MNMKMKTKTNQKPQPKYNRHKVGVTNDLILIDCTMCGMRFGVPESYYELAIEHFGTDFYCPKGHQMYNIAGRARIQKRRTQEKKREERRKIKEKQPGILKRILFFKLW